MKRIFLTGGTGNAGRPVVKELLRRGYEVYALARWGKVVPGCRTITGDLNDIGAIAEEVSTADAVVHLASPRGNCRNSVMQHDIEPTGQLLDAWRRGNFVYASSQTVYGIPVEPLTESSLIAPVCWYDMGKVCNEYQLRMAEPLVGRGAAVSLRTALLFGASERCFDRQFLPFVYEACCQGAAFVFDSEEGLETYGSSFIGEGDFGEAIAAALSIATNGPYNIAGGFCTWKGLIESFSRQLGSQARFVIRCDAQPKIGEVRLPQSRSLLETSRFVQATSFVAQEPLEELINRFVTAMRSQVVGTRIAGPSLNS